jgi:oligopeptidase B
MKWAATLRAAKTNDTPLLLKVDLEAGHLRSSDRYSKSRSLAFEYAFVIDQLGLVAYAPLLGGRVPELDRE